MPEETCFRCDQPSKEISAYITKSLMPVCEDCLNLLVERYWWDKNSLKVKRAKGLFLYPVKSKDEVLEELDRYLSPLPLFREKRLASDNIVAHRLIRTPEFRRIPLLRES